MAPRLDRGLRVPKGGGDLFGAYVGETDRPYQALGDEGGHSAPGLLQRDFLVDPVELVEIYVIDAEAAQGGPYGLADVLAVTSDGTMWLYPGNGSGGWKARRAIGSAWNTMSRILR